MQFGTVALVLLAAWLASRYVRGRVRESRDERLPAGVTAPDPHLRDHPNAEYYDACLLALRQFAREYRLTFQHGRCTRAAVMTLHTLRDDALKHLYELRMRLPNDMNAEAEVTAHVVETDALLRGYLDDAQARCGEPLLHPGPIDDMHYRQFYRAANDATE